MAEVEEDMVKAAEEHGPLEDACVYASDKHGIVTLTFHTSGAAAAALSAFSGRFYSGRRLQAAYWDGVSTFGTDGVAPMQAQRKSAPPTEAGETDGVAGGDDTATASTAAAAAEAARLEAFGTWLEGDGDGGGAV